MDAENFWCSRSLFSHQESPNAGHIEKVLSKGGVEHLHAPFTISYFVLCSSSLCLLGGDGSRSDLLVDQKSHLGGRILQGQHQLFSHQQCLKIEINRRFIFSSLINKAEINSSYLKRRGEDADNVNPAPPPRSILVLIGNVNILPESGRQNLWSYR